MDSEVEIEAAVDNCSQNKDIETETAVEVDINASRDHESPKSSQTNWRMGIIRTMFHVSPDNKMAMKMYGTKKHCLKAQQDQDRTCCMRWMIHPCSHFKWYWDIVVTTLLIFTVTVLPVSIAFYSEQQLNPEWLTINILVDFLFMTDVLVNFRTGIYAPDDEVILDPKIVAKRYLKSWFVIDIGSSFPFDYCIVLLSQGKVHNALLKASRVLRVVRLAKLLSLLKLLRISRLLRFMSRWEEIFDLATGAMRILKLIMLMLLLAHWNGCIQFLVPVIQEYPSDSWISINHLKNATVGEQYSWSLFKAISHMLCIGFGRWPPQNTTEVWLTIISMMVGATFYALFIGNMSTLLLSIDSSGRIYNEKLNQVDEYMRYRKLPQDVRQEITEYYEHRYRRKFFNEEAILNGLSQGLKEKIVKHNCQELLESVPFFENAPEVFITAVLTRLKFELFLPGEYIVRLGSKGDRMYFIQRGVVEVIADDGSVVTNLSEGAHFGEICLLTDDRRVATIKAHTMCDLFSLSKQNFEVLLEEFPEMRPFFETIAKQRLDKIGRLCVEDETKVCRYSSSCCLRTVYSETTHSPTICHSQSTAHDQESTANTGRSTRSDAAKLEKCKSYQSLHSRKSEATSITSTRLELLEDEAYAQINPHFVVHEDDL